MCDARYTENDNPGNAFANQNDARPRQFKRTVRLFPPPPFSPLISLFRICLVLRFSRLLYPPSSPRPGPQSHRRRSVAFSRKEKGDERRGEEGREVGGGQRGNAGKSFEESSSVLARRDTTCKVERVQDVYVRKERRTRDNFKREGTKRKLVTRKEMQRATEDKGSQSEREWFSNSI